MYRADLEARIWGALGEYHQALKDPSLSHGAAQAALAAGLADLADEYADTRRHRRVPPEVAAAARAEEARLASLEPEPAGPPSPVTLMARRHLLAEAAKPRLYRRKSNDERTANCA